MVSRALSYEICGARNRQGSPCSRRPHPGKRRCWLHGGAPGSGAPKGNQNALKHGHFTGQQRDLRRSLREPNEVDRKLEEIRNALPSGRKPRRKRSVPKDSEPVARPEANRKDFRSAQKDRRTRNTKLALRPLPSLYLSAEKQASILEALREFDEWQLEADLAGLEQQPTSPPQKVSLADILRFVEKELCNRPGLLPKYLAQIDKNPNQFEVAITLGEQQFVARGPVIAREVAYHASRKALLMLFERVWKAPADMKCFAMYILHEAVTQRTGATDFFANLDYEALDARPELTEKERHLMLFDQALPPDCF